MTANQNELSKEADTLEAEIAKGEQNEVLEEYPQLEKERIKEKPRSKPTLKTVKPTVSKVPVKRTSPRIEELARPVINNVLCTLRDKAWILPPAFVDNLKRIVEAKTCLNPEEAAQVLRRKKRKTKKATRFPSLTKGWTEEIIKLDTGQAPPILDRNVAVCQYLLAVNFVKSILERQCQTRKRDLREIERVILKRLMLIDEYADIRNGNDDRATQQLHLLAEIIACWIAEILADVAEADKETLEEYYKKKEMKKMEVDDDEETDSEVDYWEQMEQKYEMQKKSEDIVEEKEKEGNNEEGKKENNEREEEKEENNEREEEKEENVEDEKTKQEQKPEEDMEKKGEDEEVLKEEKEENETTET